MASTVDYRNKDISIMKPTLWDVHSRIGALWRDDSQGEKLCRIVRQNAGIAEQLINHRLTAASEAAHIRNQLHTMRLPSPLIARICIHIVMRSPIHPHIATR